jgi:hypothetical protein
MADYRYEITMATDPAGELAIRAVFENHPTINRWKMHSTWRTRTLTPSVTIRTLVSTGPTINKADLDNEHIAIANELRAVSSERVVVSVVQAEKILELP